MTDASTLLLALLTLHVLLGALSLAVARGRRSPALRLWGYGLLAFVGGFLAPRVPAVPPAWRSVAAIGLTALAAVLCASGALTHTSIRLSRRWLIAGPAIAVAVVLANQLQRSPSASIDEIAERGLVIGLFVLAAWALLRHPPAHAQAPARMVAVALALVAGQWLLGSLLFGILWAPPGPIDLGLSLSTVNLLTALLPVVNITATVAASFGLLWIETRTTEAVVERFTHTDLVTGLPNKRGTIARFKDELARSARHRRPFALVLLDVDRFKQINETHGHAAADAVLKHVADVLRAAVRGEDQVGHVGGEEFALLLPEQPAEGAARTVDRLREQLAAAPCRLDSGPLTVTISAGLAVSPDDGREWDALAAAADRRMLAERVPSAPRG